MQGPIGRIVGVVGIPGRRGVGLAPIVVSRKIDHVRTPPRLGAVRLKRLLRPAGAPSATEIGCGLPADHHHLGAQEAPDGLAKLGHEEQEAQRIGDEARRQKQDAGDRDHQAGDEFAAGHTAGAGLALDRLQRRQALAAQENRADHGRQHHEAEGGPKPDRAADGDEDADLEDGHHQEQEGDQSKRHRGQTSISKEKPWRTQADPVMRPVSGDLLGAARSSRAGGLAQTIVRLQHRKRSCRFECIGGTLYMGKTKNNGSKTGGVRRLMSFGTIFIIVLAAIVLFQLYNVLGRRTGNERPPYDPYSRDRNSAPKEEAGEADNVVTLPNRRVPAGEEGVPAGVRYGEIDKVAEAGTPLNKELRRIKDADPAFEPGEFVEGAKIAYEMVVNAFAEGDRKTLQNLLSQDVYEGFEAAITQREESGETMRSSFIGINDIRIVSAELRGRDALVTLRIVSEMISATLSSNGDVVDGDLETVVEVRDIWTFGRDTRSRDPNWKLVGTESEE